MRKIIIPVFCEKECSLFWNEYFSKYLGDQGKTPDLWVHIMNNIKQKNTRSFLRLQDGFVYHVRAWFLYM
jgi:hypothetical protein